MNKINVQTYFKYLIYALIYSTAFGQLTRFQINNVAAFYLHDLLSLVLIISALVPLWKQRKNIEIHHVFLWQIIFIFWALVTLIWASIYSSKVDANSWLYLFRYVTLALVGVFVFILIKLKLLKMNILKALFKAGIISSTLGLIQYLILPDTRFLYDYGWDDHLNRLIGVYFDPGFTGVMLGLVLLLGIYLVNPSRLVYKYFSLSLLMVLIGLTYSRASYLALTLSLIVLVFSRYKKLSIKLLLSFFIIVMMLPKQGGEGVNLTRTYSVGTRVESSNSALSLLDNNYLFGIGFNTYRNYSTWKVIRPYHVSAPDNSFVFVLITTGVIGLLIYLIHLWKVLKNGLEKSSLLISFAVLLIVHSFFNNTLFYPFIVLWWGLILSSILSVTRYKKL